MLLVDPLALTVNKGAIVELNRQGYQNGYMKRYEAKICHKQH